MKFSIVTPTLNRLPYLRETGASILSQIGNFHLEWLIIDGGSTDGTVEWLHSLGNDTRVRWTSEPDSGQSDAINKGLAMANGDVVAWLNADDLYLPNTLANVANAMRSREQIQWLVGRYQIIDERGRPIRSLIARYKERGLSHYSRRALLRENFISQPAVFWRREFGEKIGLLDTSLHYTMDYDLWLRMSHQSAPLILDEVLAQFRLHPGSKTGAVDRRQFDEQFAVACRYLGEQHFSRIIHRFNVEKIVWAYRLLRVLRC